MKILRTLGLLLLLAACQREMPLQESPEPVPAVRTTRLQTVSTRLESDPSAVKSVISVEAEDFRTAYLFAFDATTGRVFLDDDGRNIGLKTESKTFNWTIPVGPDSSGESQTMDVYAIVNPDSDNAAVLEGLLERTDVTEAELEALTYVCDDARSLSSLETDGMPMSGVRKGLTLESADEPFVLTIKRLFARYDIRLNVSEFADAGWTVTAAEVSASRSNRRAEYFYTGSGAGTSAGMDDLAFMDFATETDMEAINTFGPDHKSTGAITLYLLENCQGDIGPASRWDNVYNELGDAVACCSYVDFAINATHPTKGVQSFRFRLYPGQDDEMKGNFDIVRNTYRKLCLKPLFDTAAEGFRFIGGTDLRIAPGESKTLRYETSLTQGELVFEKYYQDSPTTDFEVSGVTWLPDNPSSSGHSTDYPYYGMVTIRVASAARPGTGYEVRGGNASGDIGDRIGFTVTDDGSFWKDVDILRYPEYRGQWMVVQLPESVFGVGERLEAFVYNMVCQPDGSYRTDSSSTCTGEIARDSDSFGNGKTNINKSHLWYEKSTNRLFVYCHIPQHRKKNCCVLNLSVIDSAGGEEFTLYSKDYEFTVKEPLLRIWGHLDETQIVGKSTITTEGAVKSEMEGLYFVLVDPDTHKMIDNQDFEWGGDNRGHHIGGRTYAPWKSTTPGFYWDNFFIESRMDYNVNESDIKDRFTLSLTNWPDEASYDFNIYNFSVTPTKKADFPYHEDMYISFWNNYFDANVVDLYPTCELLAAPRRELRIMEAMAGTSEYSSMRCSGTDAEEESYLMYGFKKTYFVRLDNLSGVGTPSVSLSRGSAVTPYLQYSLNAAGSGLYRLDLWVDRYEDPLSLDDTAVPYPANNSGLDEQVHDRAVTVTVSSTYAGNVYQDQVVCNVIHKRFNIELQSISRKGLRVKMWNPLGIIIRATAKAYFQMERYWYKNPLAEALDGIPSRDTQTGSFVLSAETIAAPLSADFSAEIEALASSLRGIRCSYARALHPSFIQYGFDIEDLILYYPAAEAKSMYVNFEVAADGFSSTVPGLSLNGITFNLKDFITFNGNSLSFDYYYRTLSEYYLQAFFYEEYNSDKWYYSYRFATPTHWSANNTLAPFKFTNDAPMQIGGNDSSRSIWGQVRLDGAGNYEQYNPTVRY